MNRASLPPTANVPNLVLTMPAPPALNLTRDEKVILAAFRDMDGRAKYEALIRMVRIARTHPLRAGPRLRLIDGGAK